MFRGEQLRFDFGGKLIGVRSDDQLVQPLHAVVVRDEFCGQIIEQLLVRRHPPSTPKSLVVRCRPSPKCHAQMRFTATRAKSGLSGAVSQSTKPSLRPSRKSTLAGLKRKSRLDRLIFFRPLRVAGRQNVALLFQQSSVFFDSPIGGQVGWPSQGLLLLQQGPCTLPDLSFGMHCLDLGRHRCGASGNNRRRSSAPPACVLFPVCE